jgi:hypothetical protein
MADAAATMLDGLSLSRKLVNPATGRKVLVNYANAKKIANSVDKTDIPLSWLLEMRKMGINPCYYKHDELHPDFQAIIKSPELSVYYFRSGKWIGSHHYHVFGTDENAVNAKVQEILVEYPPAGYGTTVKPRSEGGWYIWCRTSCD